MTADADADALRELPDADAASVTARPAATVPIIYTPAVHRQTVALAGRLTALAVALAALAVLVVGLLLPPSSTGVGTHRSMGFQRCEFLARTRLPCPSCGMTTSVSHFAKGNWLASLYVQPGGFLVALACGALFWAGLYEFATGSPLHRLVNQVPALYLVPAVLGFFIAAWGWKIFIHLRGAGGWQ